MVPPAAIARTPSANLFRAPATTTNTGTYNESHSQLALAYFMHELKKKILPVLMTEERKFLYVACNIFES